MVYHIISNTLLTVAYSISALSNVIKSSCSGRFVIANITFLPAISSFSCIWFDVVFSPQIVLMQFPPIAAVHVSDVKLPITHFPSVP